MNRRDAMRTITSGVTIAAVTGSAAAVANPISAELAALIEAHGAAHAAFLDSLPRLRAAETAWFADRNSVELSKAVDDANEIETTTGIAERAAFSALMSYRVRDIIELQAVVRHARDAWWDDVGLDAESADSLLNAIMAGGRA